MERERRGPLNVLVVEDDPIHAKIVARALEATELNLHVAFVTNGEAAVEFARGSGAYADRNRHPRPDLILLDLRLPRMDGLDVLRALRSDEATQTIPVSMITTSDRPEDVNRSYACGCNVYVTKPADFQEFSRKIKDMLGFWIRTAEMPSLAAACI